MARRDRLIEEAPQLRASFRKFIRASWHIVEPAYRFMPNWHIDAIGEHLQAVANRQIKNLVINIPPGHAKSLLVAVQWPAWMWIRQTRWETAAAWRGLFSSYSSGLSIRDSIRTRSLIDSSWYHDMFEPQWHLTRRRDSLIQNSASGFRMALSVGGRGTGERGDDRVVDDPLNVNDQHSEVTRKEVIRWWDRTMSSRMNNLDTGASIIIMQRLHEEDLSGHCIAKGNYQALVLPSEFDPERRAKTFVTFRGTRQPFFEDPRQQKGELLFPALFPRPVLEQAKLDLASYGYAGQHQQLPAPESGGIFKRDMFQRYKEAPPELEVVMCIWDCAFKDAMTNDFVAGIVGGFVGARCYILDLVKEHLSFDGTENAIKDLVAKWTVPRMKFVGDDGQVEILPRKRVEPWAPFYQSSVAGVGIEDAANGPAIISRLRKVVSGVIPLPTEGGKLARAWSTQPSVEGGQIYIPEDAPWAGDLITSLATFPNAKHDDDVDAFTHLLAYARRTMAWNGLIEYYKREQGKIEARKTEAEVINEAMKQAQIGNLKKPATAPDGMKCPECEATAIGRIGISYRCNQCGHQWGGPQIHKPAVIPQRGGMNK